MLENTKKNEGIESERNAGDPETKRMDRIRTMPENSNQNQGIDSGRDIEEPETKGKDRIWAQGQRTPNKTKCSILSVMLENLKQKEAIESRQQNEGNESRRDA